MMQGLELKTQKVNLNDLIPRPSPCPAFDHLPCAKAYSKERPGRFYRERGVDTRGALPDHCNSQSFPAPFKHLVAYGGFCVPYTQEVVKRCLL